MGSIIRLGSLASAAFVAVSLLVGCDSSTTAVEEQSATRPAADQSSRAAAATQSSQPVREGTVVAWGYAGNGTFGDGDETPRPIPQPLPGFQSAIQVTAPGFGFAALYADGTVWQIGRTGMGYSDDPGDTVHSEATKIEGLPPMVQLAPRHQGLAADGTVWAWGGGDRAEFGDGSYNADLTDFRAPAEVDLGVAGKVVMVDNSTALNDARQVIAWGCGRFGSSNEHCMLPTLIPGLPPAVAVTENLALTEGGDVWDFSNGQPVKVQGLSQVERIFTPNVAANFAVLDDGSVVSWGIGGEKYSGTGNPNQESPQPVPGISYITSMGWGGCGTIVASDRNGDVWAWGDPAEPQDRCGEFGGGLEGSTSSVPVKVPGLENVLSVGGTVALVG
jgi:alpha-tubulin suppressor-like RCC1 family protein